MTGERIFKAFQRLFPQLSSRVKHYRKINRDAVRLYLTDDTSLVFRYETNDMWQLQTYEYYANR